jgi:flavin-dependent dehydrogenase
LTLARQLRLEAPARRLLVVEKRPHPVPEAAHKVGESTVEIGANYLHSVLDLVQELHEDHLRKFGLRYFFPHNGNHEVTTRIEVGLRGFSPIPSFQLDRGRLENTLLQLERDAGTEMLDGCSIRAIRLGERSHEVALTTPAGERTATARWVIDASGRTGVLRRQLGLGRPVSHAANACWFRIGSRIAIDDWSDDPAWRARVPTGQRWLSTNHLMGPGYWVWLIPLGSGSTSFGIVADAAMHPFARIDRFPRALEWLREFEPQCARIVGAHESELQDFHALQHYAFSCTRMYSADGWALTGDAGAFTDPFYSPGTDLIALSNECISELIARDDAGADIRAAIDTYNRTFFRLFEAFLRVYEGQYGMMGSAQAMTAKVSWDNASYWAIFGLLFLQRRFRRPDFLDRIDGRLRHFSLIHARMQQLFHAWAEADRAQYESAWVDVLDVEDLRQLQAGLIGERMNDGELVERIDRNFDVLQSLASTWQTVVAGRYPQLPRFINVDSTVRLMDLQSLQFSEVPAAPTPTAR